MIVVTQSCVSFRAFALTLSHYPGNSIIRCMIVVTQSCAVFPYCPLPIASVRDDSQASCLGAISAAGSAVLQLGGSVVRLVCCSSLLLGPPCFSWGALCCQVQLCAVRLVCCQLCCQLCVVSSVASALCCQLCAFSSVSSALCFQLCVVSSVLSGKL